MIPQLFQKLFNIRKSEIGISLLMQLYIFLIITVLLIVKPTVNALFINNLGAEHLPYGYILVAVIAVISTYIYNSISKRFSALKLTTISLFLFAGFFLFFGYLTAISKLSAFTLYFYYLFVSLFAVLATSQFWILANMVFDVREGKRIFSFIGIGAISGGIFGGYLTSFIVSNYNTKTAIYVAVIFILICIPLLHHLWRLRNTRLNLIVIRKKYAYKKSLKATSSFHLISKSKHLKYIAIITAIGVFVAKLIDYQFSDFANQYFDDSASLTSFFGFWFSTFNVISLLIQFLVTNRLINRKGVAVSLLILPMGIVISCLLFIVFPELWAVILLKGIDGVFKQSVNKSALELAILPIPHHIKNQTKSFIDVAVDSLATGLSGLLIILFVQKLQIDIRYITVITIVFVLGWIVFIFLLREVYYKSFIKNIELNLTQDSDTLDAKKGKKNEPLLESAVRIMKEGSPNEILALLERLSDVRIKVLKKNIIQLLSHSSNKVKIAAVNMLQHYDDGEAVEEVKKLMLVENEYVIANALYYLIKSDSTNTEKLFKAYLNHENPYFANAALLCLAKEGGTDLYLAKKFQLKKRMEAQVNAVTAEEAVDKKTLKKLLLLIAYSRDDRYYEIIAEHLQRQSLVTEAAIKAAGITADDRFLKKLLKFLTFKKYRKNTIKALGEYGIGVSKKILALEVNDKTDEAIKKQLPKVIGAFKNQESIKLLFRLLQSVDVETRLKTVQALRKIRRKQKDSIFINNYRVRKAILKECGYYKFSLNTIHTLERTSHTKAATAIAKENVIDLLRQELDISFKCMFALLDLYYNRPEISIIYSGLVSEQNDSQSSALELFDNISYGRRIKRTIFPILEYKTIDNKNNDYSPMKLTMIPKKELFQRMLKKRGKNIKLATLEYLSGTNSSRYKRVIKSLLRYPNREIRNAAAKVLRSR